MSYSDTEIPEFAFFPYPNSKRNYRLYGLIMADAYEEHLPPSAREIIDAIDKDIRSLSSYQPKSKISSQSKKATRKPIDDIHRIFM